MRDAGRFHSLVIDIPPDTICPRCDLIFNDTAELQRHLASREYPPPEGHSSVINAETFCWCQWKKGSAKGTDTKLHNAVLKTLRVFSQQVGSQRRSLHVLDDSSRGARLHEIERAIAHLLGTGGDQGKVSRPRVLQGLQRSRACCKRCRREAAQWERQTRREWQTSCTWHNTENTFEGHSDKQE